MNHPAGSLERGRAPETAHLAPACVFNSPLYDDLLGDFICGAMGLLLATGMHDPANKNVGLRTQHGRW